MLYNNFNSSCHVSVLSTTTKVVKGLYTNNKNSLKTKYIEVIPE